MKSEDWTVADVEQIQKTVELAGISVEQAVHIIQIHAGPSCWTCTKRLIAGYVDCKICKGFSHYKKRDEL